MKKTIPSAHRNVIGRRVREARLKAKPSVSQNDLSGRLAARGVLIDQTGISRIESQTRYVMDYEAQAIARALKVSVSWLFDENH